VADLEQISLKYDRLNEPLVPAKAGTQGHVLRFFDALCCWVPAFAGTNGGDAAIQSDRKML